MQSDSDEDSKLSNDLKFLNRIQLKESTRKIRTRSTKKKLVIYSDSESITSGESEIEQMKVNKEKSTKMVVTPQQTPCKGKLRSTADLENVTPPKQAKCEKSSNDIPSKSSSPSSLFQDLELNSHSPTGIHSLDNETYTASNRTRKSIYQSARKALYSSAPKTIPGRENELKELNTFITKHVEQGTSGSLYISGSPGTGKTATLSLILHAEEISKKLLTAYINCTGIKSPGAIYSKIMLELGIKTGGGTEKEYVAVISKFLKRSNRTVLLVLDEIDQLSQSSAHQRTLYTIFSLPSSVPLLLIGIANALDLTDRLLPRLQSRCSTDVKPELLHFAPYTRQQIVTIFTERLKEAVGDDGKEVFDKAALAMLAGKVAGMSGDVRKALDIGRRVVEMLDERQTSQTNSSAAVLKSIENNQANSTAIPKTVNLHQVMQVLNTIYGTSNSLSNQTDHETFPLQQKIIICSLLLHLKHGKSKDITVGKLHEIYNRICTKKNIVAVDQAEFYALLSLVETRGIIRVVGKSDRRLHKVNLQWDEGEVELALRDKEMISSILQDDSCLKRI